MKGHFLFLGTGGSMGIPVIGCHCPVCRQGTAKDVRLRASGLLTVNNKSLLIDCGPDFRQQMLKHHIEHLDGVMITHAHHDHTASIDELRALSLKTKKPMLCLMSQVTLDDIHVRFKYIFDPAMGKQRFTPKVEPVILEKKRGEVTFQEINIHYFTYEQGGTEVNGFRIGNFAYVSDIHDYEETIYEDLDGVEVLVLSALRFTPSHLHFTVDEAIDFSKRVGAKETWLTHISHDLEHEQTNAYLPKEVRLAYDGLQISFQG